MPSMVVIRPGAIGLSAAAAAHRAGVRVRVAGRRGGKVPTVRCAGDRIDVPGPVLTDPELAEPPDWLVLAVKTYQTADAAGWLRALTGDRTRIVVMQNGVEQVADVAPYAPSATILPAIVWWPAERDADGDVEVRAPQLWLTMPAGSDADEFAGMMEPGGLHVNRTDDMRTELWRKLLLNAVFGLMVLAARRAGMFADEGVLDVGRALGHECVAVAQAVGAALTAADVDTAMDQIRGFPADVATSMLIDRLAGAPMEWAARNEVIARVGRAHGIPTPVSDVVVPLLRVGSGQPVGG